MHKLLWQEYTCINLCQEVFMFIVLNRQKIYSYIISIATVCMLFVIAGNINTGKNAITTSATTRQLPIYNVITDEKKVALTMNCAW